MHWSLFVNSSTLGLMTLYFLGVAQPRDRDKAMLDKNDKCTECS
jgi:hypothetical protein